MKLKYTGSQAEITVRGVTFKKGKAQSVTDAALARKLLVISGFEVVKSRGKSNDKNKG